MLYLSSLIGSSFVDAGGNQDPNIPSFPVGITTAELGTLIGVTEAIQTQLDGKSAIGHNHDGVYEPANPDLITMSDVPTLNLNGGYF